jgi:hypothetical protein
LDAPADVWCVLFPTAACGRRARAHAPCFNRSALSSVLQISEAGQADTQREEEGCWVVCKTLDAARCAPYPTAACRRSPCPRPPFWNLFALSSLSQFPEGVRANVHLLSAWRARAASRDAPAAVRGTPRTLAYFLWLMLLQRWTPFFAAPRRPRGGACQFATIGGQIALTASSRSLCTGPCMARTNMHMCVCLYLCVCMYVCMYKYVHIYNMCKHTEVHTHAG